MCTILNVFIVIENLSNQVLIIHEAISIYTSVKRQPTLFFWRKHLNMKRNNPCIVLKKDTVLQCIDAFNQVGVKDVYD